MSKAPSSLLLLRSGNPAFSGSRRRLLQGMATLPVLTGCDWWFGSGSDGSGTTYSNTIAEGRRLIEGAMQATATSSVSVALLDGQEVVWAEAFGKIRSDEAAPATPQTRYNIGSVSKVLTAIAVMQLVDRGQVELDAPASRYLPEFRMLSPDYGAITVRMLINHSSGLPGTYERNLFTFTPGQEYAKDAERAMADLHLKAQPGAFSVYCNDGFTMAGRVVAEVSGMPYPEYVRRHIFEPLGMSRSGFGDVALPEGEYAHADLDGEVMGQEFVRAYATGGAFSTPEDMLKLAGMFINEGTWRGNRILSVTAVRAMAQSQVVNQPLYVYPDLPFGLGWDSVAQVGLAHVGVRCWQKNGGTALYGSDFFVLPGEQLALMITGTSTAYGAGTLAEQILLNALVERGSLQSLPAPVAPYSAAESSTDAELDAMVGCYGAHDRLYRVQREAGSDAIGIWYWQSGSWQLLQGGLRRRSNGDYAFNENAERSFHVRTVQDLQFLEQRFKAGHGHYRMRFPLAQRLEPLSEFSLAWRERLSGLWVLVNEDFSSVALDLEPPTKNLESCPDLPGYVLLDGEQAMVPVDDQRTGMILTIPVTASRDLREVVVHDREDGEWLWINGLWYRPVSSLATLVPGQHELDVDNNGYTAWVKMAPASRVEVQGSSTGWRLYSDQWEQLFVQEGAGSAELPAGTSCWLAIFGQAGDRVPVIVT